jgi:hypothetical protein
VGGVAGRPAAAEQRGSWVSGGESMEWGADGVLCVSAFCLLKMLR